MTEIEFYEWKKKQEHEWYVCVKEIHPDMTDEDCISIWGFMATRFNEVRTMCDKLNNLPQFNLAKER